MKIEIIHGDCLDVMAGINDNSVDMVFTDPPYGHNNNNNGDLISNWEASLGQKTSCGSVSESRPILNDGPEANEIFKKALIQFERILKPGCCCCCCGGGGGPDPMFARWSLEMDKVFEFKQMVVWDKGPMGMGWHYRRSYEVVLVAQKKGDKCRWFDTTKKIENIIRPGSGIPKILPSKNQHPTEKPNTLAAHFINLHTQENDLVLDAFCGSGSTGVAAMRMNRNFIGIELDPKFVKMATERLNQNMPLFKSKVCS